MQQRRLAPSVLLAVIAIAGVGCTASTLESAAAPTVHDGGRVLADAVSSTTAAPVPVTPPVPPLDASSTSSSTTAVVPSTTAVVVSAAPKPVDDVPVVTTSGRDPVVTMAPVLAVNPCGAIGAVPAAATAITSIELDADGDGATDTAMSYLDGGSGVWAVRLSTASGSVSEYEVPGVPPGFVEVLGAIPFGGGPHDSFLAIIGSGASALRVGLFGSDADGCLIRHGGDDLALSVGGSIGELSGIRCGSWHGGHFVESLGAAEVEGGYNVYGTTWHLDDAGEVFSESGTHLFGASFEDVESLSTIDCPGIAP